MTEPLFPAESIDTLIARRLPAWLVAHGNVDWLLALRRALHAQEEATHSLHRILQAIPALDEFAATRLNQVLNRADLTIADLRRSHVGIERTVILPPMAPGWPIRRHMQRSSTPLLAAVLHNFHIVDTRPSPSRRGWLLDAKGEHVPVGYEVFAGRCREADVGGRYQAILQQCLAPDDAPGAAPGSAKAAVHRCFEENARADLEVAVRCALLKGELDENSYRLLLPCFTALPTVPAVPGEVAPRQLYLLGKCVRGVVTLELRPAVGADLQGVCVWVPNDPQSSVGVYRSWEEVFRALARRLTTAPYRRFFSRFISERDRVGFQQLLEERIEASAAHQVPELDGRHLAIDTSLFSHVRGLQIDKLLDDAHVLAVPTADLDEQERDARLHAYRELGLNLLNLAGMFVPVLGEGLLAYTAVELAGEVYEGYQDWRIGDRQGAMDHVFGVAQTVVAGALIATGASAVRHYLQRVPFVDALQPMRDQAGKAGLVAANLPGYSIDWSPGDDLHEWVWHLDGAMYRVSEDPVHGSTRIRHASRGEAWQPRLESNGGDGWRHELERPGDWQGAGQLVRRLSSRLAGVPDAAADYLLQATGLSEARLRRLHLEQVDAPARLYDALDVYRAHERFPDLAGPALEQQLADSVAEHGSSLLARAFPGLSRRQLVELMAQCSGVEREQLLERQRMPLALAERARWQLRERRLDRACAGLYLPRAVNADSERIAFGVLGERLAWPPTLRLELRERTAQGALLASAGSEGAEQVQYVFRRADGYRSPRSARSHSLQWALLTSLDEAQLAELGNGGLGEEAFGQWLLRSAASDREQAATWCGMQPVHSAFRPPRRFGDGRLGYPLSGRGSGERQAIRRGIQQIFPTLSDDEIQAYLLNVNGGDAGLWEHYTQLQEHLAQLRTCLRQWRQAASNPLQGVRRRRLETALRRCWRRKVVNVSGDYVLDLDGEHFGSLPQLPQGIRFDHVKRLYLRDSGLTAIDEDFLLRFGNLVELDLSRNRLTAIPAGLESLERLRTLTLSRNHIVLDSGGEGRLVQVRNLQLLDLSHNPLGRAPVLTTLRYLREVRLRSTGLEHMPEAVSWRARVDLRDNRIRQLRQDLARLRLQLEDHALHDNPLDEADEALLEQARATQPGAGRMRQHRPVDDALFERLAGAAEAQQRIRWRAIYDALGAERGAADLFRFLADFAGAEDFDLAPARYRARIWRILEFCEQHEAVRVRLFAEAGGPRTCEDRLLLTLEQLELGVMVERAVGGEPAGLEGRLWRLGRSLWRLDEVDRLAVRHIERLRAQRTVGVDEVETRLYYRLKLSATLDLPIEHDEMHYPGIAHVTSSDLLRARDQILANETPEQVIGSLAQRPFWEVHTRERHPARFEHVLQPLNVRMESLEEQVSQGQIDDWTFALRCKALKYEYEQAERRLLLTLAQELHSRL